MLSVVFQLSLLTANLKNSVVRSIGRIPDSSKWYQIRSENITTLWHEDGWLTINYPLLAKGRIDHELKLSSIISSNYILTEQ